MDKITELTNTLDGINKALEVENTPDDTARRALEAKQAELNRPRHMTFEGGKPEAPTIFIKRGPRPVESYSFEELAIARMLLETRGAVLPDNMESRFQSLSDRAHKYTMTTGGTGTGAELVDTLLWSQLFEDVHANTEVANLFRPYIDMVSGKYELPVMNEDDIIFRKPSGEGVAVTASDLGTSKPVLTAFTLKAQIDVSDEESEDSIIEMLSTIRTKLVRRAAAVIDSVILNGDTTGSTSNINKFGAAVGGTEDYLIGFDGLIHYAIVDVTGQKAEEATLANTSFTKAIHLLGKYADDPSRLAFIIDRGVKDKALDLADFLTLDKIGDLATILSGQLAQAYGVPVLLSGAIAKSDANGRVDGVTPANNTKGRLILVNRDMWKVGLRRQVRVAIQRDEPKTLTSIVASFRLALQTFGDRSSASYAHSAVLYNIAV